MGSSVVRALPFSLILGALDKKRCFKVEVLVEKCL
jgi:hypothetical protein